MKAFKLFSYCSLIFYCNHIIAQDCTGPEEGLLSIVPIETFDQCMYGDFVLVFQDDFNSTKFDASRWSAANGIRRDITFGALDPWANSGSKMWYNPDNLLMEGGKVKIVAENIPSTYLCGQVWNPSTSSMQNVCGFHTFESGEFNSNRIFHHGYFEAVVKLPKGRGFFPAFWMFEGGPRYNEIDIFEFWNERHAVYNPSIDEIELVYDPDKLTRKHHMNIQYDYDNNGVSNDCSAAYLASDSYGDGLFHKFGLLWEKDKVQWIVDDNVKRTVYRYFTILGQTTGCQIQAWHQYILNQTYSQDPMSVYFDFAIQHNSGNDPDVTTPFPSTFEIEYFKFYKRMPCVEVFTSNTSGYILKLKEFNVIRANSINFNSVFTVPNNQQLDLLGGQEVVLMPGFTASNGSVFTARIAEMCSLSNLNPSPINLVESNLGDKYETQELDLSNNFSPTDVLIYPNPNDGSFYISLGNRNSEEAEISIIDMLGKNVAFQSEKSEKRIWVKFDTYNQGLYTLNIIMKKSGDVFTHSLIIE